MTTKYGVSPTSEITSNRSWIGADDLFDKVVEHQRQAVIDKYYGGIDHEEIIKILSSIYPEKFI